MESSESHHCLAAHLAAHLWRVLDTLFKHHWVQRAPTSMQFIFKHRIPNLIADWWSGKLRYPRSSYLQKKLGTTWPNSLILWVSSRGKELPCMRSQSLLTEPRGDLRSPISTHAFALLPSLSITDRGFQFPTVKPEGLTDTCATMQGHEVSLAHKHCRKEWKRWSNRMKVMRGAVLSIINKCSNIRAVKEKKAFYPRKAL